MKSTPFDICVLTAANERQARGYRQQLEWRQHHPLLSGTDVRVIPDPDGKRIGSGGSTFYVLSELYAHYGDSLYNKRVLILHSGGDSRRLPAYSAVGKIFMPLPTQEHRTLFDVMLENYAYLPNPNSGHVVIASGDVLLNFDPDYIRFSETGVTGVAYAENPAQGEFFGVYVVSEPQPGCLPATDILQKPTMDELRAADAIDAGNRIWIDTGILNLASDTLKTWLQCDTLIEASRSGKINYNLYHEILYAMQGKRQIEDSASLKTCRVFVNCLPYCGFYHVGKSSDLLHNFYTLTHASAHHHFQNAVRSNATRYPELKSAWIYNSYISAPKISAEKPCLIEGCLLENNIVLEGQNILTNIPTGVGSIHLKYGVCLNVLPLETGQSVAVIYGIQDSFKGPNAAFLNQSFANLMSTLSIAASELWDDGGEQDIWTAKLFPAAQNAADAVEAALELQDEGELERWRTSERFSMSDILLSVDQQRLLRGHEHVRLQTSLLNISALLENDHFSFSDLKNMLRTEADKKAAMGQLESIVNASDLYVLKARAAFWLAQLVDEKAKAENSFESSFAAIRHAVASGTDQLLEPIGRRAFGIRSDEVVWAMLPARLDFAGGWTDTPPVCLERGGAVLNASVTLNGQYPIQVIGKIIPNQNVIGINSIDLGRRAAISSFEELMDFNNPAEWLSLPKAAFFAAGIFTRDDQNLASTLKKMGGGFDLTLFSALPAGSGLGTSSILGAGLIAVLSRMMGVTLQREELYARTSNLEQLMTTGGGWQDQIGGVAGGVKLISTQPGYDQSPQLAWTNLKQPGMELGDYYLLYYTGIRRLAKNLLRQVVGRYLNRDAEALQTLQHLADLAVAMKVDLDFRRSESFGQKIRTAWQLNTTLDAGQSTPEIDAVLARIEDYSLGAKLLGAGGGGFLFIAAKDKIAAQRIRQELEQNPPNDRARFFDFDIDAAGMRMSVL